MNGIALTSFGRSVTPPQCLASDWPLVSLIATPRPPREVIPLCLSSVALQHYKRWAVICSTQAVIGAEKWSAACLLRELPLVESLVESGLDPVPGVPAARLCTWAAAPSRLPAAASRTTWAASGVASGAASAAAWAVATPTRTDRKAWNYRHKSTRPGTWAENARGRTSKYSDNRQHI